MLKNVFYDNDQALLITNFLMTLSDKIAITSLTISLLTGAIAFFSYLASKKSADQAEKTKDIMYRQEVIPCLNAVKSFAINLRDCKEVKVGNIRDLQNRLSYLLCLKNNFIFLNPLDPLIARLNDFYLSSSEDQKVKLQDKFKERVGQKALEDIISKLEEIKL